MEKLNQNTVTLARNNEVSVGSVIVWHSSDLTLDANFNLQSFSSTLVLQEQLIGEALRFANEHASLLAREIALNQQNVVAESNIVAKIENIKHILKDSSAKHITHIQKYTDFDIIQLSPAEANAQYTMQKLSDYLVALQELKLKTFILLANVEEATATITNLEDIAYQYKEKIRLLHNEINFLETRYNTLYLKILTLRGRANPAKNDLVALRAAALNLRARYIQTWNKLQKLILAINSGFQFLCGIETNLEETKAYMKELFRQLEDMQKKILDFDDRIQKIEARVYIIQEEILFTYDLAQRIDCYIQLMTHFINRGLIRGGRFVSVEYKDGFAKIHANFPEYEPRTRPKQQCFDQKPIEIVFDAPPCPPVMEPCTTVSSGETTTQSPTTTTTQSPTTSSTQSPTSTTQSPTTSTTSTTTTTTTTTCKPTDCGRTFSLGGLSQSSRNHDFSCYKGIVEVEYSVDGANASVKINNVLYNYSGTVEVNTANNPILSVEGLNLGGYGVVIYTLNCLDDENSEEDW